MTARTAYQILTEKNPDINVIGCYEYDTLFVFHVAPSNYDTSESIDDLLDSALSVNKTTGLVRDFKPFHIPMEEYDSGKMLVKSAYTRDID